MVTVYDDDFIRLKHVGGGGPDITERELESALNQVIALGERLAYDATKWAVMVNIMGPILGAQHGFRINAVTAEVEGDEDNDKGKD